MEKKNPDVERIFNLEKWQILQDSLAQVTRLAIITTDYRGIPLTEHSLCQPFCQCVRADPILSKCCQRCDSIAGLEAVRTNRPFIYRCHFNIVDIAIPIIVNDNYIGAVMAGQIRLLDPMKSSNLEQLLPSQKNAKAVRFLKDRRQLYEDIPVLRYAEVCQSTQMLFQLSNYVVGEAVRRISGEGVLPTDEAQPISPQHEDYPSPHHHVLEPAFQYIYGHKNEALTQKQMAAVCHLSPSYFSRLFADETHDSFSHYIARIKIDWAMQMLEETEDSITEISERLGFSTPGYFIKSFKKLEHITPLLYRKYCKEKN
jgi:ligand-binding sensor protein/AraC-like DNA-binding protein